AFKSCEHDLRVTAAAERVTFCSECGPQIGEIVDLAIERHDQTFIARQHRLSARVGEVNDSKAAMAERDHPFPIHPGSVAIRSAMTEGPSHWFDCRKPERIGGGWEKNSGDPAHRLNSTAEKVRPCCRSKQPDTRRLRTRGSVGARASGRHQR